MTTSLLWKVVMVLIGVIQVIVVAFAAWVFSAVMELQKSSEKMATKLEQDGAQWMVIREHGDIIHALDKDVQAKNEVFEVLLQLNRVGVREEGVDPPEANMPRERGVGGANDRRRKNESLESFREVQMKRYDQMVPRSKGK